MNERSPSPRSRLGLYLPFAALAVLCLGWTAFWFYLSHRAEGVADGFVAREAERGRQWLCPDRRIDGFPFRIAISCARPQLVVIDPDGLRHESRLGGLTFHARILSPGHFIATFAPPFTGNHETTGKMELSWKTARASLRAGNEGIGEGSLELVDPVLSVGPKGQEEIRALARNFEFHLRRSPGNAAGTDLVSKVNDLSFAPLDALTGNPAPIRFEFQASVPGLIADPGRRFQDIVEEWRLARGQARVIVMKLTKGQAEIDLAGVLGLDGERRFEGNLQGRAKGIDQLISAANRRGGVDLGSMLGRLSGGQGLPVALTLQNGWMRFGPIRLVPLNPLY